MKSLSMMDIQVEEKMGSGLYNSASEVVHESLRREIRKGLDSGSGVAWDTTALKQKARQHIRANA